MKPSNSLIYALLLCGLSSLPSMAGLVPAPATFAQGLEQSATQDFKLVDTGSGVTLTASSQIYFVFSNVTGTLPAALQGPLSATLTLNLSSSTADTVTNGIISEGGFTGSFSINLNTPYNGQTNLLSGTIATGANATLSGKAGGTAATLSASTPPPGSINYNSAFVQFLNPNTEALSFALSSVVPAFADNGSGFLSPFTAAGSETFSSEPPPVVTGQAPEPVSMLILGFGLLLVGTVGIRARRNA